MRVLVVDDSRSLADVLVEGLRDQGMAVDAARDGLEAAAKLDVNAYDVVVLDRDLPGIHGDALCQMITDHDNWAMVLMLTAAAEKLAPEARLGGLRPLLAGYASVKAMVATTEGMPGRGHERRPPPVALRCTWWPVLA